jgi:LPS-assembly protein
VKIASYLTFFIYFIFLSAPAEAITNKKIAPSLTANVINISDDGNTIHAFGEVQIVFGNQKLKASSLKYNKLTDKIEAIGPLILTIENNVLFLAEQAFLDSDLNNLTLVRAKFILANSLEIFSTKVNKTDGKLTNFYETVASTCKICNKTQVPLWEIRAKKIIHNSDTKQVHFYKSKFVFLGIPLAYLPILRVPDPSVKRFKGFLVPELDYSNTLGTKIKLPYFLTLGEHSDVIIEPTINKKGNNALGIKFQRLFASSDLNLNMFATNETAPEKKLSGYIFTNYAQRIKNNSQLNLQFQRTTDQKLFSRLKDENLKFTESFASFKRQDKSFIAKTGLYQSTYQNSTIPNANMPNINHHTSLFYVFNPKKIGGQANLSLKLNAYQRESVENGDLGRDAIETIGNIFWKKNVISENGFVTGISSLSTLKASQYYNDTSYKNSIQSIDQFIGIDLSIPLMSKSNKSVIIYEPKFQLVYSIPSKNTQPDEDSLHSEISVSNFSNLNRSYGFNKAEDGLRFQSSIRTSYKNSKKFQSDFFIGSTTNLNANNKFTIGSGIPNNNTNFLGEIKLNLNDQFNLKAGVISDENFGIAQNDFEINYNKSDFNIYSKFFFKKTDNISAFKSDRSELNIGTDYKLNQKISTNLNFIYDVDKRSTKNTKLTSKYKHDCLAVDFSIARNFNYASSPNPGFIFGVKFELIGVGGSVRVNKLNKCEG